jgi:parallel beta-helix repeat protein
MKKDFMCKLALVIILFSPGIVSAYTTHQPILIENIQATPENPYIIEGYEISNPTGDCIKVLNSKNIIIRNNYLHNCGTNKSFQKETDHYQEGYATLIGESSNVTFENNVLENNFRGFMGYNTTYLKASSNKITNTTQYSPLWCERCSNSEFSFNYLADSGDPMRFWDGERSIGIWIKRSDNVIINDNTVIRSTSDGISVTGHIYAQSFTVKENKGMPHPQADWTGLSTNTEIYNNVLLDNMEQGVWLVNARNINVYNNKIRTGCFTPGAAIFSEFNVGDSNFYNNKILGCMTTGFGGGFSFNINSYNNSFYSHEKIEGDFMFFRDSIEDVISLALRQGADYRKSENNHERDNKILFIGGDLAMEMREKLKYARENKTGEMQGWMACTKEEGGVDEDCLEREIANGVRGIPAEQLLYSSLMDNFDEFVIDEPLVIDKEKKFDSDKSEEGALNLLIFLGSFILALMMIIIIFLIKTIRSRPY